MRSLSIAAVFLAVLPAFGAPPPGPTPAPAAPPTSAAGREAAIGRTNERIDSLLAQAKKDRFELIVDVYRNYSDKQISDPKQRTVTLEDLLAIVKTDSVMKEVRARAAATISLPRVMLNDPMLDNNGRKERRKRAEFSAKVNKLLLDNDEFVRQLGKDILEGLWAGWGVRVPAIKNCNVRDRNSCVEANRAWTTVFKT